MKLRWTTPRRWVDGVLGDFDTFLIDHAACERKASGLALSLVCHYPDRPDLVRAMTDLSVEELAHFREVVKWLLRRNLTVGRDEKDPYVNGLRKYIRTDSECYLLDRLVLFGIVEKRGHERFSLVAASVEDPPAARFLSASRDGRGETLRDLFWSGPAVLDRYSGRRTTRLSVGCRGGAARSPPDPRCGALIRRYLQRYGDSRVGHAPALPRRYEHVLVVPAFAESDAFVYRLSNLRGRGLVLAIVVCNCPEDADARDRETTRSLWNAIGGDTRGPGMHVKRLGGCVDLLAVDAWSAGREVARQEGVGAARALGSDLAMSYMCAGALAPGLINWSDADAHWREDYLTVATDSRATYLHRFEYQRANNDSLQEASDLYHAWLWYHVAGLTRAESPYAYCAVGSTISVAGKTLAQVRGVPRRAAGEDFHLLNKARKVSPVVAGRETTVELEPRRSERVPFGTGPGVARLQDDASPRQSKIFLAEGTYRCLGALLAAIRQEAPGSRESMSSVLERAGEDGAQICDLLQTLGADRLFRHLLDQRLSRKQRITAWMTWLDGLKTLRFLHGLRDAGEPSLGFADVAAPGLGPADMVVRWRRAAAESSELLTTSL